MKKDDFIVLFALLYLTLFAILYTFLFFDFRGFLIVFFMLAILSIPSLLCILIILRYEKLKKKSIPKWLYLGVSVLIFAFTLILYKDLTEDPRNLFPIFEEPIYIIILLFVIANSASYVTMKLLKKL